MKNAVFQFELRSWLKSPLFYFLGFCFFAFSSITMLGTGGFFDGPVETNDVVRLLNSAFSLTDFGFLLGKLLLFMVAIFAGFGLYRDYGSGSHSILYTFPIHKSYYLNGKLMSGLMAVLALGALCYFGILLGELLLGTSNPKIAPFRLMAHVTAFGVYLIPSLLIAAVLVFVVVGLSRNSYAGFMVAIGLVLLQMILENVLFGQKSLLALLDPFGQHAFFLATADWNRSMQNSTALPIDRLVIANRILWAALAGLAYLFFYKKFNFQYSPIFQLRKSTNKQSATASIASSTSTSKAEYSFSFASRCKAFVMLLYYDFKMLISNWMVLLLTTLALLAVFFVQVRVSNTGEFNLMPYTRLLIGAPLAIYTVILSLCTFLFAGLLMHRSRVSKMNLIMDATPVSNWQLVLSKIGAISLLHVIQLALFFLLGLGLQVFNAFYNFELSIHLFHLALFVFPVLLVWNLASNFVHSLVPNVYLGLFLLAGLWLGAQSLEQVGINSNLLKFNTYPALTYSDFQAYGYEMHGYLILIFYWLSAGLLLGFGTLIVYQRGVHASLKDKLRLFASRFGTGTFAGLALCAMSFIWIGSKVYEAEKDDKVNQAGLTDQRAVLENYKEKWEQYAAIPQASITDIDLELDIYPIKKRFRLKGKYIINNKHAVPVDTLFLRSAFDESTRIDWKGKVDLIKEDTLLKSCLYKLKRPLEPGENLEMEFEVQSTDNTVFTRNSNVISDGTYLQEDILPRFGYQFGNKELSLDDVNVRNENYMYSDADYVNLRTRISTGKGQIPIAPGDLIAEEEIEGRVIYTYKTPNPVKIFFSFHSADYEIIHAEHKGVGLDVYFKPNHEHNLDMMITGLKASLDYNTKLFGPYPYKQIRVIEFPLTEESFTATLTSNNVPSSEILFNVNPVAMEEKLNLPFYVMAHEVTHEWFGNQLMPAAAEGAKMLTESITEYLTLCIYRASLGEEMANKFLETQLKRYERGKKREKGQENPLYKVQSHQQYIAYGKGAAVLDRIAKLIGRDKFNGILAEFLETYRLRGAPYPTSEDFIALLEQDATVEQTEIINGLLRTIEPLP